MAKHGTVKVSPEVAQVLGLSDVAESGKGWLLRLPSAGDLYGDNSSQMLPRELYLAVDKVLKAIGGKWTRGLQGHVFPTDPRPAISAAIGGEVVDEKKVLQQFYTPPSVAEVVVLAGLQYSVSAREPGGGHRVLEPSAGRGALVRQVVLREPLAEVVMVELDPKNVAVLQADFPAHCVLQGDFLAMDDRPRMRPSRHGGLSRPFDVVVMNPPFHAGADIRHVAHAMRFLKPGGVVAAVVGRGAMTGTQKLARGFQKTVERYGVHRVDLDEAFKEAGTAVATTIVVMRRPQDAADEALGWAA